MFDIGFTEILVIGVVALIVLGPERLPTALRTAGLLFGKLKRTLGSVQKEISDELRVEEMRRAAKEQQEKLESGIKAMERPFHETLREEMLTSSKHKEAATAPDESRTAADTPADSKPDTREP